MNIISEKTLLLAPHNDDLEFGGGSVAILIDTGNEVFCVAFSACRQSVRKYFTEEILITKIKEVSVILGIKAENLVLFDYDVRTFNYHRQ